MEEYHRQRIKESLASKEARETLKLCMGLKGSYRYDEELFCIIAKLFCEMHNLPRAGLYWMMTKEQTHETKTAIESAIKGFGQDIVERLPLHVSPSQLPKEVLDRIKSYLGDAGVRNIEEALEKRSSEYVQSTILDSRYFWYSIGIGCIVFIITVMMIFACGVYFILKSTFM